METERLIHRQFTLDDLDKLVGLRSDPDVVRYLGGEKASRRDWNRGRLEFYTSRYDVGLGMHGMYWKESGEMIGWSGLQELEGGDEVEVGYGMSKDYWRKGIGYETAVGWLKVGFEELKLERIVAVAMPENKGSWRIMEKLGMSFEKSETYYEMDCHLYAITRDQYLAQSKVVDKRTE